MKLVNLIKSLLCPSVDKTLNTFQRKIDQLNERIDFDVDEINHTDKVIDELHERKQVLLLNIVRAENAVGKLEEITG